MSIKLMIVDDHEIVRLGLAHLFKQYDNLDVTACVDSASEAMIKIEEMRPDVVIMDIRLKEEDGIEACRKISATHPDTKVIILTSYGEEDLVLEAILAGAKGYVLKDVGNEEIVRAVRAAYKGESLLDTVVTSRLLNRVRKSAKNNQDALEQLTDKEMKVLAFLAQGKTNREIAKKIFLSEKTVRNYVSSILSKLNLANRTEAAAYAARRNLPQKN
ncbi:response regulator transcription factor [Metallumcola ferriviriculae]|uniref:Stage 0 sporulation protein A homolog n=1 Tax=Metallumcola ferriviriculae TaxID=3039180 RepID=A0AAU0UR40_9FIRM|nr:response regulator transcription factor [Desulfitibacteraceae bacterium MK1]